MVVGFEPSHVVYIHAGMIHVKDFELVILVSGRKDKFFAMLPFQAIGLVYVGAYASDCTRGTAVLAYYGMNLVVRVGNLDAAIGQIQ